MLEFKTRLVKPALTLIAAAALAACSPSSDGPKVPPKAPDVGVANFSAATGKVPYPFDYFFLGTTDGTLNIPASLAAFHGLSSAVNALDGWSTNAPLDTSFSLPIDPASIGDGAVKIIKLWVDPTTKAPTTNPAYLPTGATSPVAGVLTYGTDFTADVSPDYDSEGKYLRINLKKPLAASMGPVANNGGPNAGKVLNVGYLVFVTSTLKSTNGNPFAPDTLYKTVRDAPANCSGVDAAYAQLCAITKGHLGIIQAATGVSPSNVILSWWFSTQSVDDVLAKTVSLATAQPTLIVPTGLTTAVLSASFGKADIYVGSTQLPYYLTVPANANDSASVMGKYWTGAAGSNLTMFNPTPVKTVDVTVPVLVTVPNASSGCPGKPANGWPVAVFQHGITGNRTQALPLADAYATACVVVVAMDLPLHGITDTNNPFYCTPAKAQCLGATERTFNIDIMNNTTGAAGPDGKIDPSGGLNGLTYFNLASPLTWRDNMRQSEVDLGNITKSVPGLAVVTSASPLTTVPLGVDPTQIHFVAHSIGAMVGGAHVHFSNDTRTAVLANPGGPIALIAKDSAYFGPIATALLSKSAAPNSYNFNMVYRDLQAVLDSADPYNHVKSAAAMHPMLMFEVTNDQTVPNSSTNALIAAASLAKAKTIGPNAVAAGAGRYTLFSQGTHGTLLDWANQAATYEMQKQAVSLAATSSLPGGPFVVLTNPTVLDLN